MNTYFFTFKKHNHPQTGELMEHYYLEVQAHSFNDAYDWMVQTFDTRWHECFPPKQFKKELYPKGRYGDVVVLQREGV